MKTSVIKDKRNHKRVISSVRASMAMEGLQPSLHAQALGKLYLEDKITGREAIARIKERHSAKFGL
ncbi:antitoxin VbhA family protein [Desulfosporosinus sp. OT]|uniref:antitoxin VbhA family protein n=1 Tax=Desulfosporosinus sp. OT TaxID=913865 RepID=UPI00058F9DCD|nr:antitoxin VbhA family protein [Desulfosporosinus sp. OT]